ncbi:conjugative transposon protein TraM [Flavobacterium columnare]|uniref:conjugative transposon protein TraM n=1 Tax=Flavobacterium columnare TaxID=996 RepID=UPI0013FDBF94|nr:conjugative transposon protein TraM [Flavobacterium columnare]
MEKPTKNNSENKRKFIVYGVIGVLILGLLSYGIADYSSSTEENPEKIEEIGTPESELDKYNSKVEAVGVNEKPKNNPNNSLIDIYDNSKEEERRKKEDEELKKLEAQLQNIGKEKSNSNYSNSSTYEENKPVRASRRKSVNFSNSISYAYEGERYKPEKNYYPPTTIEQKPVPKVPGPVEEKLPGENGAKKESGFFKKIGAPKMGKKEEQYYACVHTDQTVMDGNRVKLRLIKEATINGDLYPINTIIYGLVKIRPNRLMVTVNKINQTEVDLTLFDAEDSNEGMYVVTPNLNASLKKELNKEVLDDDDLNRIPFSKSLKAIFSKKAKEERITLLNNYKIIIKRNPKKDEI